MPIARFEMPDGRIARFEVPEGLSPEEAQNLISQQQIAEPSKPAPERTTGEAFSDVGSKLVSGIGGLAQLPGQIYGLTTGAIKNPDFAQTGLYGVGQKMQDWAAAHESEALKAKEAATAQKVAQAEKEGGQFSAFKTQAAEVLKDPAQLAAFLAEQAPQAIPSIIAAMIPGVGPAAAAEIRAAQVAARTATSVAAKEAAEIALKDAISAATKSQVERGATSAVRTGAVQQGADIGSGTYEDTYKYLIEKGATPQEAADKAINLARAAGVGGAALSLLASKLPGAQAFERALAGEKVGLGKGIASRVAQAGMGAAKEIPGEQVEEVGGKFLQNLAQQQVNPEQSLTAGLGQTGAQAAIGAGGMGAIGGIRSGRAMPVDESASPAPATPPAPVAEDKSEAPAVEPISKPAESEYVQLQRKRQALLTQPKTQEVKDELSFLESRIKELNIRKIEEERAQLEKPKQSAFSQEELPAVISREDLEKTLAAEQQAKEAAQAELNQPAKSIEEYAPLQQEKQRLIKQPQTPEIRSQIKLIDSKLSDLVARDIESRRKDKAMAESSAFNQENLPPVESRDYVLGTKALDELQAKEEPAVPMDRKEIASIKRFEKLQGTPAPESEIETQIKDAEKAAKSIKSTDLTTTLKGKLAPDEVSDIAPKGKGFEKLSSGAKNGTYISEMVSDGLLNDYLPPHMHPGSDRFDAQEASEIIKNKLRDKDTGTFDAEIQQRILSNDAATLSAELQKDKEAELALAELEMPLFARAETRGQSIGVAATQNVVDTAKQSWSNAPESVVVADLHDPQVPIEVRAHNEQQKKKGAKGEPEAFFYKGKVYLVADQFDTPAAALKAYYHEALGHYGLRGVFGKDIEGALNQILKHRDIDVRKVAQEYGLDMTKAKDRLVAAEEVLTHMAQNKPGLTFVRQAISAIRNWLRNHGVNIKLSDNDIIQNMILPAQKFVEQGRKTAVGGETAFSRAGDIAEKVKTVAQKSLQKREPTKAEERPHISEQLNNELNKVFAPQNKTIVDRIDGLRDNFFKKLAQGVADQYRTIKDYSQEAYMLARLSKTVDGALDGLMMHGHVFLDSGALNIKQNTKGLLEAMKPLGKDVDTYMQWVALNREARLPAEKRSDRLAPLVAQRDELAKGELNGRPRLEVYQQVQKDMNALNKSVLDVALKQGLIDKTGYDRFSNDLFYVPFYRAMEDGDIQGASTASSLSSQKFSKELKGQNEKPFGDLMENTLRNWSHILSAAMKNQASNKTMEAAIEAGAATPVKEAGKGTIKTMIDGQPQYFEVHDPMLMDSISSIGYMGPNSKMLDVARDFKNYLQFGVTIAPPFKVRNLFRDSIAALINVGLGKDPFSNVAQGWAASDKNNPAHISAMAGGAIFNYGSTEEGNQARSIKRLIKKGVPEDTILDTPDKIKAGLKKAFDQYQDWGNKSEAANRMALYLQLKEKGASHLEATFAARDMLDFSMQGSWQAFRLVSQVVPFLNARVQGLYKLGRDGAIPLGRVFYNTTTGKPLDQTDVQKAQAFGYTTLAVAMASMALYLAFKDDEDYQKREDWDRDNFWWFKVPGMDYAFRVPKPFEIGAIGTIAERTLEQIVDNGAEGKQFEESIVRMLADTFSMNPVPQAVKPLLDLYANKDSFTGAPIESAGMERLSKQERATDTTSPLAKALGGASAIFGAKGELSPVQVDYAIKAYFGWLGGTVAEVSHYAVMPFNDGEYPDTKVMDRVSMGFIKSLPSDQSRYVTAFYENNKQIGEAFADMRHFSEAGEMEKVAKILEEKGDKIALNKLYDQTSKNMANVRKQIRVITNDVNMDGADKREEITRLKEILSMYAQNAEDVRKSMK